MEIGDFTIVVGCNRKETLREYWRENYKDTTLYVPSQKSLILEDGLEIKDFSYLGIPALSDFNEKIYSDGNPYEYLRPFIRNGGFFSAMDYEEKEYLAMKLCGKYASRQKHKGLVIIEDPEIALSPENIMNILVYEIIMDMISLGNKVIISTTSSIFLEFAWILKNVMEDKVVESMYKFFGIKDRIPEFDRVFDYLRLIKVKVYSSKNYDITDISSLCVIDPNVEVSEWGGLLSIPSRSTEIVSEFSNYN